MHAAVRLDAGLPGPAVSSTALMTVQMLFVQGWYEEILLAVGEPVHLPEVAQLLKWKQSFESYKKITCEY